jgi:NADPH:quinone reductase-like Zn-dependent oxidoreductase
MPAQHTVYRVTDRKSFHDVRPFTEDVPEAGPHELLLEIKAVSLNYRDLAVANGEYPFPVRKNVVPVSDCAALVSGIGPNVTTFAVGDKVLVTFDGTNLYGQQKDWNGGHGGPVDGFLRQYAVVNDSFAVKVPPTDLSYPELASLVCTGTTAWNAMYGAAPTKPGDVVLVQGGWLSAYGASSLADPRRDRRCIHDGSTVGEVGWLHGHCHLVLR